MKRVVLTTSLVLLFVSVFGQVEYKLELIDSVAKTKSQIYSDTKMFIAEQWKSANNVIQNDDKEAGLILVKGRSVQTLKFQMNSHVYTYSYTVKFFMKDQKYRILIENVNCESAICGTMDWPLIQICDKCEYPGYWKTSLSQERWENIVYTVKAELLGITANYATYIKATNTTDW